MAGGTRAGRVGPRPGGARARARRGGPAAREREVVMTTVTERGPRLGIAPTCAARGLPRATYSRRRRPQSAPAPRPRSPRALSPDAHAAVLARLYEPRFVDLAPAEV